jgi:uncharacterized membrane protein YphA (DoxX/SURF4 family)
LLSHFKGAVYYFSSEKNKRVFLKNPLDYLPEYGGWCAYAIGKYGEKVSVDPISYIVENGDLYLFYNSYFNNTKDKWIKNQTKLHHKADENWLSITNKQTPNHMKNKTSFIIRLLMSVILFQSLYFKFGGHDQAVYIFSTLGVEPWGRYLLGTIELVFAVALLVPKTKHIAAVLTGIIMMGAIASHLLTPLGIVIHWNDQSDGGQLFAMAIIVLVLSTTEVFFIRKR